MEATPNIEIDEEKSVSDTLTIFNRINLKDLQQFKFVDIHTIYRLQTTTTPKVTTKCQNTFTRQTWQFTVHNTVSKWQY